MVNTKDKIKKIIYDSIKFQRSKKILKPEIIKLLGSRSKNVDVKVNN